MEATRDSKGRFVKGTISLNEGDKLQWLCVVCGKETEKYKRTKDKRYYYLRRTCSDKCRIDLRRGNRKKQKDPRLGRKHSLGAKRKISMNKLGIEKIEDWDGFAETGNHNERVMFQKTIHKQVLQRDNYTCTICGEIGVRLHVDHILPFSMFVDKRFDIDNCRTLCVVCHFKVTFSRDMPENSKWGLTSVMGGS